MTIDIGAVDARGVLILLSLAVIIAIVVGVFMYIGSKAKDKYSGTCNGHGVANPAKSGPACVCDQGWTGDTCSELMRIPALKHCSGQCNFLCPCQKDGKDDTGHCPSQTYPTTLPDPNVPPQYKPDGSANGTPGCILVTRPGHGCVQTFGVGADDDGEIQSCRRMVLCPYGLKPDGTPFNICPQKLKHGDYVSQSLNPWNKNWGLCYQYKSHNRGIDVSFTDCGNTLGTVKVGQCSVEGPAPAVTFGNSTNIQTLNASVGNCGHVPALVAVGYPLGT